MAVVVEVVFLRFLSSEAAEEELEVGAAAAAAAADWTAAAMPGMESEASGLPKNG